MRDEAFELTGLRRAFAVVAFAIALLLPVGVVAVLGTAPTGGPALGAPSQENTPWG